MQSALSEDRKLLKGPYFEAREKFKELNFELGTPAMLRTVVKNIQINIDGTQKGVNFKTGLQWSIKLNSLFSIWNSNQHLWGARYVKMGFKVGISNN